MYEYDFHTYSIRRKKSRKKYFAYLFIFFLNVGLVIWLFSLFSHKEEKTLGAQVSQLTSVVQTVVHKNSALDEIIANSLTGTEGSYAVAVINKKTDESSYVNEHASYDAGSLYKLWIMAVVFEQIQSGKLQEDAVLHGDIAALNKKFHIASDSAELTEGEVNFTVASALRQMITISHNYAALLLTEKVRLSTVKKFLSDNSFNESRVGEANKPPTTTAYDIALFFDKLTKGEFADASNTEKMVTLLKDQRLNNKLPVYLPADTEIAHKTGELGLFSHDAGIVYLPEQQYIIVVMSKSTYPPGAEERIGQLSKNVYEYFTQ